MHQPHSYATEAIVLKHSNLGEADRIITLFTPYKGKVRAVAKGIRKTISKKAGHLELLCYSRVHIAQGRSLDLITQAQSVETFLHLRNQLWHMTCGFYLVELVDRFIEDDAEHLDVYRLLLQALRILDADALAIQQHKTHSIPNIALKFDRTQLLLHYFEIYLLSFIGYEPVLHHCAHCKAVLLPRKNGFNPSLGGALCPDCSHLWTQALSMNALKILRLLQRTEWALLPHFRFEAHLRTEVETAMHSLLRFHLERDLKSWSFLEMLDAKR